MKILIVGAGKIGSVAAWDLAKRADVQKIGLLDSRPDALGGAKAWISSEKLVTHTLDIVGQKTEAYQLMQGYDVGVITLPSRRASYSAIEAAIDAGLSMVDILEEYHRRPDKVEVEGLEISRNLSLDEYGERLHEKAISNRVTILDGMGFEPGLSNVTTGAAIRKLDKAKSAIVRVGGSFLQRKLPAGIP